MHMNNNFTLNKKETILIVCRDISEVMLLSKIRSEPEKSYIVASDDLRVHKEIDKYAWVSETCFLELMESVFKVADEVIRILERINKWIRSADNEKIGLPKEILYWECHCEGGMTTQRLQDLLLLIRSYLHLIDSYHITGIIILGHPGSEWEDEVLLQTARTRGINCSIMGAFRLGVITGRVLSFLKLYAREPYKISKILKVKLKSLSYTNKRNISNREIVLQLCSSEDKHLAHTVPLLKTLSNRGYDAIALCWNAPEGAARIRHMNLLAEELERWVPISGFWKGFFLFTQTWRKVKLRRQEFLIDLGLAYLSVPLGPLLWPSVRFFFLTQVRDRYRLMMAAERYLNFHFPLAIRFWTLRLAEGVIPFRRLPKGKRPIVFTNWGFHSRLDLPYDHYDEIPLDLALALGDRHQEKLANSGLPAENIAIIGQVAFEDIDSFKRSYNQNYSRSSLGIPPDLNFYLLFDPNYILRGYLTAQEQALLTNYLLTFAASNPSVALIIKPHPSHQPYLLEGLIETFSLPNVVLVDKNMRPYHAINSADVVITKMSTIAIEAMELEKPVISVSLDHEINFQIYDDAAEYVNKIEELDAILKRLTNDEMFRKNWAARLRQKAGRFLKENFHREGEVPSELAAEALDRFLKRNRTYNSNKISFKSGSEC